jgi:hypothetical protein
MFQGTDSVKHCYKFFKTYNLPMQNSYCDHRNFDSVLIKDAVQSDLRMCTKEPSFYLQTVYLGFYFILCSCKA